MLDKYIWGNVSRISPEAPVPVVEVESNSVRIGGAGNVANNVVTLGSKAMLLGIIGYDDEGKEFVSLARNAGISTVGVVIDETRSTTTKSRVIAHSQHVVRIDREVKSEISNEIEKKLLKILESEISNYSAIILEDYNKGLLTRSLVTKIIEIAKKYKKIITVDPKFNNFFEYKKVTLFKPNKKEVEEALGKKATSNGVLEKLGFEVMKRLKAENVLITRGENGMVLLEKNRSVTYVPTRARHVADVSGAGDTVIATLTVSLAAGASMKEAATLANYAGGIVCGEVGAVPILREKLFEFIEEDQNGKDF